MNFNFNKNINVITIKTIEKLKHFFIIKMKSRFINLKKKFEKFILKKNFILKLKNIKAKFKKKIRTLKSLIENLYKTFLKIIKHV